MSENAVDLDLGFKLPRVSCLLLLVSFSSFHGKSFCDLKLLHDKRLFVSMFVLDIKIVKLWSKVVYLCSPMRKFVCFVAK